MIKCRQRRKSHGKWRTIGGRRVFIRDGEDLETAMARSGKFKNAKKETISEEEQKESKEIEDFRKLEGHDLEKFSDEVLYSVNRQQLREQGLNGSSEYQRLVVALKMNEKPTVLSEKEFEEKAKGNTLIYRGVRDIEKLSSENPAIVETTTGKTILDNLRYSEKTYIGYGSYGDGIYFAKEQETATAYASGKKENVATAFIDKKKAKIININDINKMRQEYFEKNPELSRNNMFRELSIFATYKGYNVIEIGEEHTSGYGTYYNILDRKVLVIKE